MTTGQDWLQAARYLFKILAISTYLQVLLSRTGRPELVAELGADILLCAVLVISNVRG